jgi:hypothetical protein
MRVIKLLFVIEAIQAIFVSTNLATRAQWIFFDQINLFSCVALAWLFFCTIDYKNASAKLIVFLYLMIKLWSLASYNLLVFANSGHELTLFCVFILFLPILSFAFFGDYNPNSDSYDHNGSFLMYKQPKGVLGLLTIATGLKGAGVALIINGEEFTYEEGKGGLELISKTHRFSTGKYYQRIAPVNVSTARLLIGEKWQIWNTCFHVFGKFDKHR